MEFSSLLAMLLIGAIAGWLSGKIMEGRGFGLFGNIIVGIVGAFLAGLVFSGTWICRWWRSAVVYLLRNSRRRDPIVPDRPHPQRMTKAAKSGGF